MHDVMYEYAEEILEAAIENEMLDEHDYVEYYTQEDGVRVRVIVEVVEDEDEWELDLDDDEDEDEY